MSEENKDMKEDKNYLTAIVADMGKLIDYFVMLHYLIKEMQESRSTDHVIGKFVRLLATKEGLNVANVEIFISIDNNNVLKVEYDEENMKFIGLRAERLFDFEAVIKGDEYILLDNPKTILMPIKSQNIRCVLKIIDNKNDYDTEFIKIIEVFSIQAVSIIENVFLRTEIEEKAKVLEKANRALELKNREMQDMQMQMIQQEKLASIGQLAAGVAHELNNPIGFILGNFNALKKYMDAMIDYSKKSIETNDIAEKKRVWEEKGLDYIIEDMPDLISESEEGLDRVITIVKNLKEFSRIDNNLEEYDINKGIENTLIVAKNEYKYVADVEKQLGDVPFIKVNGGEINEVVLNIIVNAAQAITEMKSSERKKIVVRTFYEEGFVVCEIEDNGPGIPENILPKVFDPFFTTKEPGKGTGLGLNIAYNIIAKKHNGKIDVKSEIGKGTVFSFRLPSNE